MKELDSFTVERLEEITELKALSFPPSHAESAALARIALAAKRAEPIYQYQSGIGTDFNGGIEWVWYDCDKGFYNQYDHTRRRIVYTTPQRDLRVQLGSWINCSERMPDNKDYVLAGDFDSHYWPNIPNTQVGTYADWFDDGNPAWDDGDGHDLHLKKVTHWMPLPTPPEKPL